MSSSVTDKCIFFVILCFCVFVFLCRASLPQTVPGSPIGVGRRGRVWTAPTDIATGGDPVDARCDTHGPGLFDLLRRKQPAHHGVAWLGMWAYFLRRLLDGPRRYLDVEGQCGECQTIVLPNAHHRL